MYCVLNRHCRLDAQYLAARCRKRSTPAPATCLSSARPASLACATPSATTWALLLSLLCWDAAPQSAPSSAASSTLALPAAPCRRVPRRRGITRLRRRRRPRRLRGHVRSCSRQLGRAANCGGVRCKRVAARSRSTVCGVASILLH